MNSYNYFIYPYRYHTSKTNAVLLTSLKKCQQHCIGKCRCYDLYTTPICNENYYNFERNEDQATGFLKWTDFSYKIVGVQLVNSKSSDILSWSDQTRNGSPLG